MGLGIRRIKCNFSFTKVVDSLFGFYAHVLLVPLTFYKRSRYFLKKKPSSLLSWSVYLTCAALYELGPLVGAAEGGDQDLIKPSRCERRQDTLSHGAAQSDRRKHLHVVEQQLHLVVIHVPQSSGPRHPQLLSTPTSQNQGPDRRRDCRTDRGGTVSPSAGDLKDSWWLQSGLR